MEYQSIANKKCILDKFNWKKTITRVVKNTEDGNISLKRLKKKVCII